MLKDRRIRNKFNHARLAKQKSSVLLESLKSQGKSVITPHGAIYTGTMYMEGM